MRRIFATTLALLISTLALIPGSATAGGGCHSDTLTDAPGVAVSLEKRCFEPMVVRVDAGQQVTWTNKDPDIHAVTGVASSWGDYTELAKGDSASFQFDESGVFPYFCFLHPSMVGAVVVGDGSAASASTTKDSVKAVSAEAPGGAGVDNQAVVEKDSGRGNSVPLALGLGILAATGVFAGALFLRRRTSRSE